MSDFIKIKVNEQQMLVPLLMTVRQIQQKYKPESDIVVYNGYAIPDNDDPKVDDGDELVFIKRGQIPRSEELEIFMMARHTPGIHQQISKACVGIAGCGGVGSLTAMLLTRLGIGKLVLVDYDIVEPSNLNRQQFFIDQLGMLKVAALTANLVRMNPCVSFMQYPLRLNYQNVPKIFAQCDIVAECFDTPHSKREMLLSMRRHLPEIPLVCVSGIAGYGSADMICDRRIFQNTWMVGDSETEAQPGCGLLPPRVAVASGRQANLILRILLDQRPV